MLRSFMTLVLLFGMLGGGAYAAKKYLLHKDQPKWSADVEPLATEVATTRGLQFKTTLEVTTLPAGGYATRLAASVFKTQPGRAETWRALGLLNGGLDLEAIGRQALNDSPAFYDPATKTIYVSDDLKPYEHVYRFALHRALATALLDQQFDWSTRVRRRRLPPRWRCEQRSTVTPWLWPTRSPRRIRPTNSCLSGSPLFRDTAPLWRPRNLRLPSPAGLGWRCGRRFR